MFDSDMEEDLERDAQLEDGSEDGDTDAELDQEDGNDSDDEPVNRWHGRKSLSEALEEDDERRTAPDPTGEDSDEEELDEDEGEEGEDDPQQPAKGTQAKQDGTTASATPRFRILDADGKPVAGELLNGRRLSFKGDGKEVTVASDAELIQLAQKGAAFDRRTSEQGQQIARATTELEQLRGQLKTVTQDAEETLLEALFNREARQRLRQALAPYRDPEYRRGQEALARQEEQESREREQQTAQLEEQRADYWRQVGVKIRDSLDEYAALTPEDSLEVANRFYAGYQRAFEFAVKNGADEATAKQRAFAALSDNNLRRVMRGLNAELELERQATGKPAAARKPATRAAAEREAETHNARIDRKVASRTTAPRLHGGGSGPASRVRGAVGHDKTAPTFTQRMSRIGKLFDEARASR